MGSPEDASLSRWPRLDWWFAPRWRALLTWVGMTALMSYVGRLGAWTMFLDMDQFFFDQVNRALPTPLPGRTVTVALVSNIFFLQFWIEPLALRLNLLRGLAWMGLRILPIAGLEAFLHGDITVIRPLNIVACSALNWLVLSGWRSRPWMAVLGGSLFAGATSLFDWLRLYPADWFVTPATHLPYG
jgi:hypothetical protein